MEIKLTAAAQKDLIVWKKSGNIKVLKRIRELLASINETPFEGVGKPEPLKYQMTGL
jgi:toxin YoeB